MSVIVNFYQLDEWGVIQELNDFLAPLGLKLIISENGQAIGCSISPQLYYEKSKCKNIKFEKFIEQRYYNLTTRYNKKYILTNNTVTKTKWDDPPK